MLNCSSKITRIFYAFLVFVLAVTWTQVTAKPVSAHLYGQPPFFKVNGKYSNLYPVPLTSLSDFPLPQDAAPDNYLINQTISFGFDISRLPAPPDVVEKTKFYWDFGDGSTGEGLSNQHAYTRPGSYLLVIKADDGTTPAPQVIESVMLNILPNSSYSLPKAVIKINGRESRDPLTDILAFPLGQSLHFDATSSQGNIVAYFWDFGDQKSSTKAVDDHYFPGDLTQIFPVLRIKDNMGFIADAYVEVQNGNQGFNPIQGVTPANSKINNQALKKQVKGNQLPYVLGGFGLALVGFTALRFARGRYRGRRRRSL